MTAETLALVALKGALFGTYAAWREYRKSRPRMRLAERLGWSAALLLWRLGRGKARRRG